MTRTHLASRHRGVDRWVRVGSAIATGALLLCGCSNASEVIGAPGGDVQSHVHGIGVDPTDGTVYVAAHEGLFELDESSSSLKLVAGRVQDFMGFTVVGPGEFLSSGHPGEGQDGPGVVGLIESNDNGDTWQTRSLSGEVDFHSIDVSGDTTYGLDAGNGTVMQTEDRREWTSVSLPVPVLDIAVDPATETIVATSESGVIASEDGGMSYSDRADSPVLSYVDWASGGSLYGVDPSGQVYVSSDLVTWQSGAALGGSPQAMTAVDDQEMYVALTDRVVVSRDGGATFTTLVDL